MLNFTALAELSTRQIAETAAAVGLPANKGPQRPAAGLLIAPESNWKARPAARSSPAKNYLPPSKSKKTLKP